MTDVVLPLTDEGTMPPFPGSIQWINSPPLAAYDLRGKVVVVNFCTHTCIHWLRSLPYIRAWHKKYCAEGLVVIGVHTPEFTFENTSKNVQHAINDLQIIYPVAIDSTYAIWSAFNNHYWPALYFIDAKGHIRHHQYGEGEYDLSELVIQRLLVEGGSDIRQGGLVTVQPEGIEAAADWKRLKSPKTYLGYERTADFASPGGMQYGVSGIYEDPYVLPLNHWSLAGDWTIGKQSVKSNYDKGRISFNFHARDLNLIMGPTKRGVEIEYRVQLDSKPPGKAHGADSDEQGKGIATDLRAYQLIRQIKSTTDRQFYIEFQNPGIEVAAFMFG